jgi:hypothetical protein
MKNAAAKTISLIGHPGLVCPITVLFLAKPNGFSFLLKSVLPILFLAALFMAFAVWQVRRRRWRDVDASRPVERKTLNRFLVAGLVAAALATAGRSFPPGLSLGFFISALQIAAAMLASGRLKLSMHGCFDAFASVLLLPFGPGAVAAGLAGTAAVCWSRVALLRHTVPEVLWGAALGIAGGSLFWTVFRGLAGQT